MTDERGDEPLSPNRAESAAIRKRQRSRATVMAVLLGLFVILVFAISIVKIMQGHA